MILVLLGTQPIPFDRLIQEVLELKKENMILASEKIIIQAGATYVEPTNDITVYNQIEYSEYLSLIERADLIITHGGAGSIFDALNKGKKVIALPRELKYKEHVDNHQIELVEKLAKDGYIIAEKTIYDSYSLLKEVSFKTYESSKQSLIAQIKKCIDE